MAGQVVLLVALVVLPGRDDWPTPPWLRTLAQLFVIAGFVVLVAASLRLGRALTATPVPTVRGQLIPVASTGTSATRSTPVCC